MHRRDWLNEKRTIDELSYSALETSIRMINEGSREMKISHGWSRSGRREKTDHIERSNEEEEEKKRTLKYPALCLDRNRSSRINEEEVKRDLRTQLRSFRFHICLAIRKNSSSERMQCRNKMETSNAGRESIQRNSCRCLFDEEHLQDDVSWEHFESVPTEDSIKHWPCGSESDKVSAGEEGKQRKILMLQVVIIVTFEWKTEFAFLRRDDISRVSSTNPFQHSDKHKKEMRLLSASVFMLTLSNNQSGGVSMIYRLVVDQNR